MLVRSTFTLALLIVLLNFGVVDALPPPASEDILHNRRQPLLGAIIGAVTDILATNVQRLANGLLPIPPAGSPTPVPSVTPPLTSSKSISTTPLPFSSVSSSSFSSSVSPSTFSASSSSTTSSSKLTSSSSASSSSSSSTLSSSTPSSASSTSSSSVSSSTISSSSASSSTSGSFSTLPSSSTSVSSTSTSPSPSSSPPPQRISGAFIKVVRASNSQVLGYIAPPKRGSYFLSITENRNSRVEFSFLPNGTNFDISISTAGSVYPNLGFASTTMNLPSSNYIALVTTNPTPFGASASKAGNSMSTTAWVYSESSIWSYDPQNKEISAIWVNTDRSTPPTAFWYNVSFNAITIVPAPPGSAEGYELRLLVE